MYNFKFLNFNSLKDADKKRVKQLNWTLFSDNETDVNTSLFDNSVVVYEQDKIIALINFFEMGDSIMIMSFEVLNKRKGYGREIFKNIKEASENDYSKIYVNCRDNQSYNFWTSLGFINQGEDLIYKL